MRLDTILQNIKAADSAVAEKTAADTSAAHNTRDQLLAALNAATSNTGVKVASAGSPTDDLMKIASEVADTEHEMAVKEAQLLGRAFADSVVSRIGEWQTAAVKTAAEYTDAGFDKFASENAELVKQAAELGYTQTKADLEKFAAEEYERGYTDTMAEVQKLAALEFAKGAHVMSKVLDTIAAG